MLSFYQADFHLNLFKLKLVDLLQKKRHIRRIAKERNIGFIPHSTDGGTGLSLYTP